MKHENLILELAGWGLDDNPDRRAAAANFLFFRLSDAHWSRGVWKRLILDHGIVVRNCATFDTLDQRYLRIAVLGGNDNQRLVQALDGVLNGHNSAA